MSKEEFSIKIYNALYTKIKTLSYSSFNPEIFFAKDEYYELALCLAYMALSKEKIIKKEIKNDDRLGRLTKYVDDSEIDKLFKSSFCTRLPNVTRALERDNLWVLDNIRDSIMHSAFEVDETRKLFIIKNQMGTRIFEAEVPFEWFIAYAKNDILKKKMLDKYTVRGFYPNKDKKDKTSLNTRYEMHNSVLYNVYITGSTFNVNEIENRVRSLFKEFSEYPLEEEDYIKYGDIDTSYNDRHSYDRDYLISFYKAKDKVMEVLNKEYPDLNVSIGIINNKNKLINKVSKKLPKTYRNYELMMHDFEHTISSKGMSLLNILSNIIDNVGNEEKYDFSGKDYLEILDTVNTIINHNISSTKDSYEIRNLYWNNLQLLRNVYLNVLGLSTLVINKEGLYDMYYSYYPTSNFIVRGYSKRPYLDFIKEERSIVSELLETEIKLKQKKDQYPGCNVPEKKELLKDSIDLFEKKIELLMSELENLEWKSHYKEYIDKSKFLPYEKESSKLQSNIGTMIEHFYAAEKIEDKRKLMKLVLKAIDKRNELDSIYRYGQCLEMSDALTIIRNAFSHIGRVTVKQDKYGQDLVVFNDYATDGTISGQVVTRLDGLINIINTPLLQMQEEDESVSLTLH